MKPHFGQMFEADSFDHSAPGNGSLRRKGFRTGRRIFQAGTAWPTRGRARVNRPMDVVRTRTAQRGPRRREEEPGPAARGAGPHVPHAGRGRTSVRPTRARAVRVRPQPGRSREAASAPHLDRLGRFGGQRLPDGRTRGEGVAGDREVRPGLPLPGWPDGPPALIGHRPRAPPRRRPPARLRLNGYFGGSAFALREAQKSSGTSSYTDPSFSASSFAFWAATSSWIRSFRNIQ